MKGNSVHKSAGENKVVVHHQLNMDFNFRILVVPVAKFHQIKAQKRKDEPTMNIIFDYLSVNASGRAFHLVNKTSNLF